MDTTVNNKNPVIYGHCVSDEEMYFEVALQNLRDNIASLKQEISKLEDGLNTFINALNND